MSSADDPTVPGPTDRPPGDPPPDERPAEPLSSTTPPPDDPPPGDPPPADPTPPEKRRIPRWVWYVLILVGLAILILGYYGGPGSRQQIPPDDGRPRQKLLPALQEQKRKEALTESGKMRDSAAKDFVKVSAEVAPALNNKDLKRKDLESIAQKLAEYGKDLQESDQRLDGFLKRAEYEQEGERREELKAQLQSTKEFVGRLKRVQEELSALIKKELENSKDDGKEK